MRTTEGLAQAAQDAGNPLIAGIYDRVSEDRAGRRRSVQQQDKANRAAAAAEGWTVPEDAVFCDNDRSASQFATKPRPDWDRLRERVNERRLHVVVLWEVSRGDRDDLDWLSFLHQCRRVGVWIHITSHGRTYDPRKRRDYKTLAEEGLDAADESHRTSERIRRDVADMAEAGRPHGHVLYGYRREYEVGSDGQRYIVAQVPDEEIRVAVGADGATTEYTRAGVVREVHRRLLAAEPARAIAGDLNRRGVPAPRGGERGWYHTVIRKIGENPAYAGYRMHHGRVAGKAMWPPLVDESAHYALLARFSSRASTASRDGAVEHLGSGLFVCGVCKQVVRVGKTKGGHRTYLCRPPREMRRTAEEKRRKATAEELAELAGLPLVEQTSRALELVRGGVTQVSIATGLGLTPSLLSWRLKAEVRRRGEPAGTQRPPMTREQFLARGFHVSRRKDRVDRFVERVIWLRLIQPDLVSLLAAEDEQADRRMRELTTQINGKQVRLDEARDAYADNQLSLASLQRIEQKLEPEIAAARSRLQAIRVGPVLQDLLLPTLDEVRAAWEGLLMPQRREVIRALVERVEILPVHDRRRFTDEESVRIVWRQPTRDSDEEPELSSA